MSGRQSRRANKRLLIETIEQLAKHGVGCLRASKLLGYSKQHCRRLARSVGAVKAIGPPTISAELMERCKTIRTAEKEVRLCECGRAHNCGGLCKHCYDRIRRNLYPGQRWSHERGGYV